MRKSNSLGAQWNRKAASSGDMEAPGFAEKFATRGQPHRSPREYDLDSGNILVTEPREPARSDLLRGDPNRRFADVRKYVPGTASLPREVFSCI